MCIKQYVPLKVKRKRVHNPWITRKVIQLKRKVKRRRGRLRQERCERLVNEITALSAALKSEIKESKHKYYNVTMLQFLKQSPQKFWRHFKKAKTCVSELSTEDGVTNDKQDIANEFNTFFASVFTIDNDEPVEFELPCSFPDAEDLTLSVEGIMTLLLKLNTSKSMGPDEIPNVFLKRYAEWMAKYLFVIFEKSLSTGSLPEDWKMSKIIPIPKGGEVTSVSNYRPIALTSTVCKILEHIVSKNVRQFLSGNKILNECQHGFREGLSTVTQLVETVHYLSEVLDRKGQVDIIYLDFRKAFDKVSHKKLLIKLKCVLGNTTVVRWIESFLTNRQQFVSIDEHKSEICDVESGVPQGSVLGPLLFLLYINDLIMDSSIQARLFADDCIIYTEVKSVADQLRLNEYLSKINDWCAKWQMSLNTQKTVCMTITHKRQPLEFSYVIQGVSLTNVIEYKYLGVTITADLK